MNKKILSVLVCLAMLFSALSVFTYAKVIEVEMDLSGLFDDEPAVEEPKEDEGEDKEERNRKEPLQKRDTAGQVQNIRLMIFSG